MHQQEESAMSDPRYGDRRDWEYSEWNAHWGGEDNTSWAIGGLVVIALLVGLAMWGANLNTTQTAAVGDDATTGQSLRPLPQLMPMSAPSP
jgi:hypothetical protein